RRPPRSTHGLHSFPTRRSSDLGEPRPGDRVRAPGNRQGDTGDVEQPAGQPESPGSSPMPLNWD
uniref:hypothetical protein n=1 Tax=Alloalcanivorax venustensis TaxID=172371 RepID=UPI003559839A